MGYYNLTIQHLIPMVHIHLLFSLSYGHENLETDMDVEIRKYSFNLYFKYINRFLGAVMVQQDIKYWNLREKGVYKVNKPHCT